MRTSLLAKIWFFLSVAVLGVAYGILVSERGWFPSSLAKNAWKQGRVVLPISDLPFLNERVYERRGVRISRKGEMQPGLTSIASSWKTSDGWKVGLKLIGWLPDSFRNRAGFRFEEESDWLNIVEASAARAPRSFDLDDQFGRPSTESPA